MTAEGSPKAAAPASRRALVVDVAYTRLEVVGRPGLRIGTLVESINDPWVMVNGVRRGVVEAWTMAFGDVLHAADPIAVTLAHPTVWGSLRTSVLTDALRTVIGDAPTTSVPRAAVIAESHMEASAEMCAVAECHDGRLDVHLMRRTGGEWAVLSTSVFDETVVGRTGLEGAVDADEVAALITDSVEAILVDGDNRDRIAATVRFFEDQTPTGRIAAVERVLLHRYGGVRLDRPVTRVRPLEPGTRGRPPLRTALIAGAATVAVAAAVVGVLVAAPWRNSDGDRPAAAAAPTTAGSATATPSGEAADAETAEVGRVSVEVPGRWRRSGDPVDADGAIPFTTFSARLDDRRIVLVQNSVREDSTLGSVAASLRNRLEQRGTDVVTEFSSATRYGGRDVISYRETPVSGGQIRWYVMVESALQVSVGCQDGGQGQSVEAQCAAAVGSVVISP